MAKGFTYFCNDRDGNIYNRYSKDHNAPLYRNATIKRRVGRKAEKNGVSYTSGQQINGQIWDVGFYDAIDRRQVPGVAESVTVRAYPGRHTNEPIGRVE